MTKSPIEARKIYEIINIMYQEPGVSLETYIEIIVIGSYCDGHGFACRMQVRNMYDMQDLSTT